MYCSHCGGQLFYQDLNHHSWCYCCDTIVPVSPCKASFWSLFAVLIMAWTVNIGG